MLREWNQAEFRVTTVCVFYDPWVTRRLHVYPRGGSQEMERPDHLQCLQEIHYWGHGWVPLLHGLFIVGPSQQSDVLGRRVHGNPLYRIPDQAHGTRIKKLVG